MNKFNFLKDKTITDLSDYGVRVAILDYFLLEKSINILFGPAGLGKTWLLFAVSKYCTSKGYDVVYLNVNEEGLISLNDLEMTMTKDTLLVSIIGINNITVV